MKGTILTRMGKHVCTVDWEIGADDVADIVKRSVALAFPAQLSAKAAGGKIASMETLNASDIETRFAKRVEGDTKVSFSALRIAPWTPATPGGKLEDKSTEALLAELAKRGITVPAKSLAPAEAAAMDLLDVAQSATPPAA